VVLTWTLRRTLEAVEKEVEHKRMRQLSSLGELQEVEGKAVEKKDHLTKLLLAWRKVLEKMTDRNREEKDEGQPWVEFLTSLVGGANLEAPSIFLNKDMAYVDMITHIGGRINALQAQVNKATNEANRLSNRTLRKEAANTKLQEKLKRKVKAVFEEPEVVEEQKASKKYFVLVGLYGVFVSLL